MEFIRNLFLFRNEHHKNYFKGAVALFSIILINCILGKFFLVNSIFPQITKLVILVVALIYLLVAVFATVCVIKKKTDDYISKDCIWFNALMSGIYMILYFFLKT